MPAKKIPVGPYVLQFVQRAQGQETPYFVARIYQGGAEVGTAENDGRGGATLIRGRGIDTDLRPLVDTTARAAGLDPIATLGKYEREAIVFSYAECVGYERGAKTLTLTDYLRMYAAAMSDMRHEAHP